MAREQKKDDYSLYYLTLDGQVPSSYSVAYDKDLDDYAINKELNDKYRIKCISFKNEIVPWIEDCIKDINVIDKKQIIDNLMQFLNVVRGLFNMGSNELNDELKKVLENSKNFEAYIEMTKCQSEITSYVLETIIFKLNEWAKENDFRIDDTYANYKIEIKSLCNGNNIGENRPGFGVECKNQIDGCKLCVVIEAGKKMKECGMVYILKTKKNGMKIFHIPLKKN